MEKNQYTIKFNSGSFDIPLYLESTVDEMGVMVGFDGDIEQVEQLCNFTYTQSGQTLTIFNTVNPDKLRKIVEQNFTVKWGDGDTGTISVVTGLTLPSLSHTYTTADTFEVSIILDAPWDNKKITKKITVPQDLTVSNPLGTFSGFTIPYTSEIGSQNYLNDLDYTNVTGSTTFHFLGMGKSRVNELKKYGENSYMGISVGVDDEGNSYTGYTIDDLYYRDYESGFTSITGSTSTESRDFFKEDVYNKMITRNEHFLGFIDDPTIYSDIFVERGKQGVMEFNLRLGEIDNIGEIYVYGNGFFQVKKQ